MSELLILDPAAVATDRVEVDLTPFIGRDGPEFGDASIEQYMAEAERGQVPVDGRVPNRQIVIPLVLTQRARDHTNYDTNPSGEAAAKWADFSADWAVAPEASGTDGVPSWTGGFRDKHTFDGSASSTNVATLNVTFPWAGTWVVSVYVWLPAAYSGSALSLNTDGSFAGSSGEVRTATSLAVRDEWQRIHTTVTVAGDLTGVFTLRYTGAAPSAAGTGVVYTDARQIEEGSDPTAYADGDMPGYHWTGEPHASATTATTFQDIRRFVQAKAALFQRQGGWIARESVEGVVYADVVSANLKLGAKNAAAWGYLDSDAVLTLDCLPDWYGDEVPLDALSETTLPEIVAVLEQDGVPATIRGDVPARARVVVTDPAGVDRAAVTAALRSRHYDAAATAALAYEAEQLTPLGSAAAAAVTGASGSGSNAVSHSSLATAWTPVLSTRIAASALELTHVGSYRIRARVRSPDGSDVAVRLLWAVGDLNDPTENTAWQIPAANQWYIADLGHVRLDRAIAGTHRWLGQIQARGVDGGEDVHIDRLWIEPVDDGHVAVTATNRLATLPPPSASDTFDQTSGNLNGKTATLGGNWATSGAATDFAVNATNANVERTTGADTGAGRFALLGTGTLAGVIGEVDFRSLTWSQDIRLGLVLRYVDANNYALVRAQPNFFRLVGGGPRPDIYRYFYTVEVVTVVGGVQTTTAVATSNEVASASDLTAAWYSIRAAIFPNGTVHVWVAEALSSFDVTPNGILRIADLASTGALASGRYGIYDYNSGASSTRRYDSVWFAGLTQNPSSAIYAGRALELATEGAAHETSDGTAYRPITPRGRLPRLPPSGLEGRPVQLLVRASRGDHATLPDSAIDDLQVQVHYRPCWLFLGDNFSAS